MTRKEILEQIAATLATSSPAKLTTLRRLAERLAQDCPRCPIVRAEGNPVCQNCLRSGGRPPLSTVN